MEDYSYLNEDNSSSRSVNYLSMLVELQEKITYLHRLYLDTMCNASYNKINDIYFVVTEYFPILSQRIPNPELADEIKLRVWIMDLTRARYILSHIDITKLSNVRTPKDFKPEDKQLTVEYIKRIQHIWHVLQNLYQWETYTMAFTSNNMDDTQTKLHLESLFKKLIPKSYLI